MNQKPQNPFKPGDRVVKAEDSDASVAVVVEVLPPEQDVNLYGQTIDGEAVSVAFPNMLDDGPGNWREIHPAKLASYCDDQDIKLYTYKHTNLEYAENPFTAGDYVIKPDYDDPDLAVVLEVSNDGDRDVTVSFCKHLALFCRRLTATSDVLTGRFRQINREMDAVWRYGIAQTTSANVSRPCQTAR